MNWITGRRDIEGENNMICTSCGREIPDNTIFCPFCGAPVSAQGSSQNQQGISGSDFNGGAGWNYGSVGNSGGQGGQGGYFTGGQFSGQGDHTGSYQNISGTDAAGSGGSDYNFTTSPGSNVHMQPGSESYSSEERSSAGRAGSTGEDSHRGSSSGQSRPGRRTDHSGSARNTHGPAGNRKKRRRRGRAGMIAAIVICLAVIAAVIVFFIIRGSRTETGASETQTDSTAGNSGAVQADSVLSDSTDSSATEAADEIQYVASLSEISTRTLSSLQQQAEKVYESEVSSNWGEGESLNKLEYLGDILQKANDPDSAGYHNRLYLVYLASIQDQFENEDGDSYNAENKVYWYIVWPDIRTDKDGSNTLDQDSYLVPTHRVEISSGLTDGEWGTKNWYYAGYSSLDNLYQDTVRLDSSSTYQDDVTDPGAEDAADSGSSEDSSDSGSTDDSDQDGSDASGSDSTEKTSDSRESGTDTDAGNNQDTGVESDNATTSEGSGSQALTGEVLPDSNTRWLTESDIEGLSVQELQSAINLIYARHGYRFNNESIRAHYETYDWYHPDVAPDDFDDDALLSETERHNLYLLQRRRNSMEQ